MCYNHADVCEKFTLIPKNLHPKQAEILQELDSGKNVCGILPTGYGKSLTFVLPSLFHHEIILVICPLSFFND